jgi:hypothetical protein
MWIKEKKEKDAGGVSSFWCDIDIIFIIELFLR